MENGGLVLAKRIATTIKNKKFASFVIIGDRDIGKSTYALKAVYEAFLILGYRQDLAWEMALSCIKFSIPSVTSYLKEGVKQYRDNSTKKPCLIWDDLRTHASGMQYFLNKELYTEVGKLLDTIKIPINVFIGTCPSMKGVMSVLQDYDGYQINIGYSNRGGNYRIAKGYLWRTTPVGQRRIYSKFEDTFVCWLPTTIWKRYEIDRIQATSESIAGVEKAAKK